MKHPSSPFGRGWPRLPAGMLAVLLCGTTAAVTLVPEPPSAHARGRRRAPKQTEAEKLAEQAAEAAKKGDHEHAEELLLRAEELEPGARWLIARAHVRADAGRLLQALSMLREARDAPGSEPYKGQLDLAAAEIQSRVPVVRVEITGPALSGRQLQLDGETVPAAVQSNIELDPGRHTFRATAPGFQPVSRQVDLSEGERRTLTLEMRPEPAPESSPAPSSTEAPEQGWRRPVAYASFAVAGAAAITGTVFYLQRRSNTDEADSRYASCSSQGCSDDERSTIDTLDQQAARDGTIAVLGLGTAALAAGAGLWLIREDLGLNAREQATSLAVHPTLGGASLSGRF